MDMAGLSAVSGSWKIMPIWLPRRRFSSAVERARRSWPRNRTRPLVMAPPGGSRRMIASAVMLLPEPDFADQTDDLTRGDAQVDAAHHLPLAEADMQAVDAEQVAGCGHAVRAEAVWRGSSASRRPSPSRLKATTLTEMAAPGNTDSHHSPLNR